jgi:hypothetical protein
MISAAASGMAQIPDVQVKADIGLTYKSELDGRTTLRFYNPFGHLSTVAFQFALEPGFRAYVSEKIQRLPNDPDSSPIDESYVEDVGVWRAGKQYLPFGFQRIFRESVLAIRSDTEPFFGYLPFKVAACDGGEGRPQGLVGRVGTRLGASFAIGTHFGIFGTTLSPVRDPGDTPGRGGGYRRAFGLDYSKTTGGARFEAEYVWFQDAHRGEPNREVLDVRMILQPHPSRSLSVGFAHGTKPGIEQFTVEGIYMVGPNLWVEPFVRIRDARFHDVGATFRVRL